MKTYKLFIRYWYGLRVEIVDTDNLFEWIGKLYCQSIEKIERVDYKELKGGLADCPFYKPVCDLCSCRGRCSKYLENNGGGR